MKASLSDTGIVDLPKLDYVSRGANQLRTVKPDEKQVAVKFGIIGTGQAGGQIADTFYQKGYRRVFVINTNTQDFLGLKLPDDYKLVMPSKGGSGKNPSMGNDAIKNSKEEVINYMKNTFGDDVERILICTSAGGGTGSGSTPELINLAKDYLKSQGKEPKVGLLFSLPKFSEGGLAHKNSYHFIEKIEPMISEKLISPVIVTDNQTIYQMFPNVSARMFWRKANGHVVGIFDTLNILASQESEFFTFDRADYHSILNSGILLFGATNVKKYERESDISDSLRKNLANSLFAEGFNIKESTHAAGVFVASEGILDSLPQSYLDQAFVTLERVLGAQNRGLNLFQGLYETSTEGLFLYTIIGGMKIPEARKNELATKAGLIQ